MPDFSTFGLFLAASLALLVVPGPAVLYIVGRGIHQGKSAALVSTLGVETGTLLQLLAATLGLSVFITSSELNFMILKYAGAALLTCLGIHTLLVRVIAHAPGELAALPSLRHVFLQGVVVEALNPKTALFLLAFLPQFADPERGSTGWQILVLGLVFIILAIFNDGLFALLSGILGGWLRGNPRLLTGQRYVSGAIYFALAIMLASASLSL